MASYYVILASVVIAAMAAAFGGAWFSHIHFARELHIAYRFGEIVERECGKEYLENETGVHQLYNALLENYRRLETSSWYMNLFFTITFVSMAVVIAKILYDSDAKLGMYFFVSLALIYFMVSRKDFSNVMGTPFPKGDFYIPTELPENYVESTYLRQMKLFGVQLALVGFLLYVLVPLQQPQKPNASTETNTASSWKPKAIWFNGCAFTDVRTHMAYGLGILLIVMVLAVLIVNPTYRLNNEVLVQYDAYLQKLRAHTENLKEDVQDEIESNYFRKNDKAPVITERNLKDHAVYAMHEKGKEYEFAETKENKKLLTSYRTLLFDRRASSSAIGANAMQYVYFVTLVTAVALVFFMYVAYHVGYRQNTSKTVIFISSLVLLLAFILTWVGWLYQAML